MKPGNRNQWIAVGIIVAVLTGALIAGVLLTDDIFPVTVGAEAPDFVAVDLATGDTVTLADYRGDVVLLNIWATWCAPCRQEMPSMERLQSILGPEGLKIVAVSVDIGTREIHDFVEELGLTFEILHDGRQRIDATYQTTGLPESFVIDRHGVIVKKTWQEEWDDPANVALFRRLLNETSDHEPVQTAIRSDAGRTGVSKPGNAGAGTPDG
jgi:cytochrome c biogenesis protein CcmG, thiol:disulfide interchange protein DsbE